MQAIQDAEKLSFEYGNQEIDQEHLLMALLRQEDSLLSGLITKMEIQLPYFTDRVEQDLKKKVKVSGNVQHYASAALNQVLINAEDESKAMGDDYVSVEHLVLAMIKNPNRTVKELFREFGMDVITFSLDGLESIPLSFSPSRVAT